MAVVVEDVHAVPCARMGEAALDPAEAGKTAHNAFVGNPEMGGDGDCAGRVLNIVLSRHGDRKILDRSCLPSLAIAQERCEMRLPPVDGKIDATDVCLRA